MAGRRPRATWPAGAALMVLILALSGCRVFGLGSGGDEEAGTGMSAPAQRRLDLAYASRSPTQKLDLLLPVRVGEPVPLVIAIHGGGWQLGDKSESEFIADPLLKQGYAVASINYRLSPEATFPAAVLDAKAAVRWLRAHAGEYGLDADRFAAWGFSAGGNLAAMIGVTAGSTDPGRPDFLDPALGNADESSAVQAVVDFYGPSDLLEMDRQFAEDGHCTSVPDHHDELDSPESLYLGGKLQEVADRAREASPVSYLTTATDIPPFYLAHGLDDCTVPDRQSTELAEGLRARGIRAELTIVPGFGHADYEFDRQQLRPAMAFLASVFKR